MSFFSKLFGRSKPQEPTEAPKPNGKPAPAPAKPAPISDERVKQIEASAKPEPSSPPPAPSGIASEPAAKKATAGLFKKRSSSGKLEALPSAASAPAAAPEPIKEVQAKSTGTPIPSPSAKPSKDAGVLEALLGNLDKSFDAIIREQSDMTPPLGTEAEPNTDDFDRLAVLELFYDIATNHLRPVRNFMIELHLGDVRKEWAHIVQPAIKSIQNGAEQIDIPDLKRALDDFDALLSIATESAGEMIAGELREEFISHYKRLQQIMPRAFTLDEERDQRESLIIHSLLMQVPDVRKVTIDKLYRAGLSALEVLFLATTEDLAATTGVRKILAQRIVDKFQLYRDESRDSVPDDVNAGHTKKLRDLIGLLQEQQARYDRAMLDRSIDDKRAHRLARQGTLLEITVVLAQLGEVELVEQLERLPFEKRIERLNKYLADAQAQQKRA